MGEGTLGLGKNQDVASEGFSQIAHRFRVGFAVNLENKRVYDAEERCI